jgi:putative Mg2+ transporter-C (MgtC) family protein
VVRVVCRSEEEQHVRALILQAMTDTSLLLHAISSRDLGDASKVEVRASVATAGRAEAALERIVGRLSLVSSVSAASWQVDSHNGEQARSAET